MKNTSVAALAVITAMLYSGTALGDVDGRKGGDLFMQYCNSCHGGEAGPDERLAPPVIAVRKHYMDVYKTEFEFIDAIVRWVGAPNQDYSLMPGAISRFKVMPPVDFGDDAPKSEEIVREIAAFIYSGGFNVPGWYAEHYREEHGKEFKQH